MKILIIGAGKMGEAVLRSWLSDSSKLKKVISVVEVNSKQRNILKKNYPLAEFSEYIPDRWKGDLILFAIKPQTFSNIAKVINSKNISTKIILSIMAGITVSSLEKLIHGKAVFFRANIGGSAQASGLYFSTGQYSQVTTSASPTSSHFGTYSGYNQQYFSWVSSLNNSGNSAVFVAEITLFNPLQTTKHKDYHYKSSYEGNNTDLFNENVSGKITTTSAVSGLTFLSASGNISKGEFVLYGVKK